MTETAIEKPVKPGWKTTEFWLSTATVAMSQLYASGLVGEGGTASKVAAFVVSILGALGYTVARTKAKG